jgi:hypothetical protein
MRNLQQSTAYNLMVLLVDSTTHINGFAGATLVIAASKDGGAFASISPTVTDRGDGWYNVALTTSHTDTLGDLILHITAVGADPTDVVTAIVAASYTVQDIASAVRTELTTELARIDEATSTRLASASYIAPDNSTITSIDTKVDVAVSTRLSAAGYTVPPTAVDNATAVRTELAVELARVDTDVSTRLSSAGYISPDNVSISAIKVKTDLLPGNPAASGEYTAAIASVQADTDALQAAVAGLPVPPSTSAIATAVFGSAVDGATTFAESVRLQNSVLAGKVSGAGTGTEIFRDLADTKNRITATVTSTGNRTAITRDAS